MRAFTSKIDRIDGSSSMPKYRQVINTIITDIQQELFKPGQRIPSINETSEEYYLSRDTVEKAYRELRQRGIISSVPGKGYYVSPSIGIKKTRVLVVFNKLCNYKQSIYNALLKGVGKHAECTLYVHRYQPKFFENLILDNLGDYDYYVVMPHFYGATSEAIKVLRKIPKNKLIILDQKLARLGGSYGMVYQDFKGDIFNALNSGKDLLNKYEQLNLVFPNHQPYPQGIIEGVKEFCEEIQMPLCVVSSICEKNLQKHQTYLVIDEEELVKLIKVVRERNWEIGKDIGIISYNDTPLKEVIAGGITVVSTDHQQMGLTAANMILNKSRERVHNPFKLIRRKSL